MLPLNIKEEDEEEIQEASTSLAGAKKISLGAAVATLLAEPDGIFTINGKRRTALKGLSWWERCYRFTPDRLWQDFS